MAEFKKKQKQSFLYAPLVLIVLFLLLVYSLYKIRGIIKKEQETALNKEVVMNKINSLKNREDSLKKDISKMQTKEGIEEIIRDKYQVVKKGEKMVVVVDKEEPNTRNSSQNSSHSFWSWIKNLFK